VFDEKTLTESQEAETRWRAAFDRMRERMKSDRRTPHTHLGLPIKNAYFRHDIEHLEFAQMETPGSYPVTSGNLAAQYQLMSWANQPVIGYGLPEHTRERHAP
jgi:methylmalonyl-CoA mutase, N-terminal domain